VSKHGFTVDWRLNGDRIKHDSVGATPVRDSAREDGFLGQDGWGGLTLLRLDEEARDSDEGDSALARV
jgi:hypothetical protein